MGEVTAGLHMTAQDYSLSRSVIVLESDLGFKIISRSSSARRNSRRNR